MAAEAPSTIPSLLNTQEIIVTEKLSFFVHTDIKEIQARTFKENEHWFVYFTKGDVKTDPQPITNKDKFTVLNGNRITKNDIDIETAKIEKLQQFLDEFETTHEVYKKYSKEIETIGEKIAYLQRNLNNHFLVVTVISQETESKN